MILIDMPDDKGLALIEYIKKGDPRCKYKVGVPVIKIAEDPNGDITPLGTKGVVVGSAYNPEMEDGSRALYWVKFEGTPMVTTMVEYKITGDEQILGRKKV